MKRKFIWWLGFVTLFVLFSVTAYGDSWPTYQGNFQRTGSKPVSVDPNTLTLDWFFEPGVGNPLNPGTPNGTGIVFANEGQQAVTGFGKVYYCYNDNADQDVLVALDASTGAYSWSYVLRLPGLGAGGLQVPTVALRTVDGVTDSVVYVYGSNNSLHCLDANTGAVKWVRLGINGAAATLVSGSPAIYDSILIIHDNGGAGTARRYVSGLNVRNGTTIWTSNDGVNPVQMPFRMFNGPTLSNDTVYVGGRGRGISVDNGGAIKALDAKTGLVLATYDPALPYGWQHAPSVFGDWVVSVSRNDELGAYAGSIHRLKHDLTVSQVFSPNPGTSIGLDRFSTPCLYVEPSVGETCMTYGVAGDGGDGLPGFVVMRRLRPGISLRSYQKLGGSVQSAGAIATGNGLLLQGDDAGYWWAMDANSYGCGFCGGLYPFWVKQYPAQLTSVAAISAEDDTLVAMIDGNGNCAGWRNGSVATRPRAQIFFDYWDPLFSGGNLGLPTTEVNLGIIPFDTLTGTGGFTNVKLPVFMNTGNEVLTYSLSWGSSPVALTAADFGAAANLSRTSPTRGKKAREFADENTLTSGNGFLEKKYFLAGKYTRDPLDMEEDGITSLKDIRDLNAKATYFGTTKLEEAKKSLVNPGWLFVNDDNAGSCDPMDSIILDIVALNPNAGYGEFFGEIKLFNTNEPDVQGNALDTTRMTVRLLVGWLPGRGTLFADSAALTKTNYGREIGYPDEWLWTWHDIQPGYEGYTVLGNADSTFAGADHGATGSDINLQPGSGYGPEDVFNDSTNHYLLYDGPFADAVEHDWSTTKYTHQMGLPLKIVQVAWAIQGDLPGVQYEADAIYQTYVIINTSTTDSVKGIELGPTTDTDVPPAAGNNNGAVDTQHDAVWLYEVSNPDVKVGVVRIPRDNVNTAGSDVLRVHISRDVPGSFEYYDPLGGLLQGWWDAQEKSVLGPAGDAWFINGAKKFDLGPGEFHTETFVWFGADVSSGASLVDRFKEWATIAGYYRGDVNGDHSGPRITLSDVQRLGNYVYPFPAYNNAFVPLPFTSQGELNNDDIINFDDVILLFNFVKTSGATTAPTDRDRFVPTDYGPGHADWSNRATGRPSLNDDANWTP